MLYFGSVTLVGENSETARTRGQVIKCDTSFNSLFMKTLAIKSKGPNVRLIGYSQELRRELPAQSEELNL